MKFWKFEATPVTSPLIGSSLSVRSHLAPIRVSINLGALVHNYRILQSCLSSHTKILAVIKADAYGHGAVEVAQTLKDLDVFGFGVASVQEGLLLRENGIQHPILVMGPIQRSHVVDLITSQLTPVISHPEILSDLIKQLPRNHPPYPVHVKVDTGLHRLGLNPDEALSLIQTCRNDCPGILLEGILTHFADADNPDSTLTKLQLAQFTALLHHLEEQGRPLPLIHIANSAGILFHHASHFDMVRSGLMLYGYSPRPGGHGTSLGLQPVLEATTYIGHLRSLNPGEIVGYNALFRTRRPSKIAVLPVGYTHGIPRNLTGKGHVLIQGMQAPIIGKICMDMMMVDVTEIRDTEIGQEVRLIGTQGQRSITAEDYATWLGTIPYEVLCGIGGKARREYLRPDTPPPAERDSRFTSPLPDASPLQTPS
jgi:alanine racemase